MSTETTPQTRRALLTTLGMVGGGVALSQGIPGLARAAAAPLPVRIEVPTEQSAAPYGAMLGQPFPEGGAVASFKTPSGMAVWRQHLFDAGKDGEFEIVWVNHGGSDPVVTRLEQHHLTEQAIIPLTGDLIHIVALTGRDGAPDLATVNAFRLAPGIGLCMAKDVWHTSRSRGITNLMLTRASTSVDMTRYQTKQGDPVETTLKDIPPIRLSDPI